MIAEQVALGLSNREVAEAVFVSVRTVEANLSRIYAKLGVRSRTELARVLDRTHAGEQTETLWVNRRVFPDSSGRPVVVPFVSRSANREGSRTCLAT